MDGDHRLILYRINASTYNDSNEIIIEETIRGGNQVADI
jgi:hypothetical protein